MNSFLSTILGRNFFYSLQCARCIICQISFTNCRFGFWFSRKVYTATASTATNTQIHSCMAQLHRLNSIQILLSGLNSQIIIVNWMVMQSVGHAEFISSIADFTLCSIRKKERNTPRARTRTYRKPFSIKPLKIHLPNAHTQTNSSDDPFIYDEIWKEKINCGDLYHLH